MSRRIQRVSLKQHVVVSRPSFVDEKRTYEQKCVSCLFVFLVSLYKLVCLILIFNYVFVSAAGWVARCQPLDGVGGSI